MERYTRRSYRRGNAHALNYALVGVHHEKKTVYIADHSNERGGISITNAAAEVTTELNAKYPGYRIIYRDSMNMWDELTHINGRHTGFRPCKDRINGIPQD